MTFIYALPAWLFLFIALALAASVAGVGQMLVHRRFRSADFIEHNDVAGFLVTVVGTLYAVVLGFITVIVWQEFDTSAARVASEAAAITSTYHLAASLPAPVAARVQAMTIEYSRAMVTEEWPAMRAGRTPEAGEQILNAAFHVVGDFRPPDSRGSNLQTLILSRLVEAHDDRRKRLQDNKSGVSWFEWLVLFAGALIVLAFCYLFGVRNTRVHTIMTAMVALIIMLMCVLIMELDYPFRGDVAISPEPFTSFLSERAGS